MVDPPIDRRGIWPRITHCLSCTRTLATISHGLSAFSTFLVFQTDKSSIFLMMGGIKSLGVY